MGSRMDFFTGLLDSSFKAAKVVKFLEKSSGEFANGICSMSSFERLFSSLTCNIIAI